MIRPLCPRQLKPIMDCQQPNQDDKTGRNQKIEKPVQVNLIQDEIEDSAQQRGRSIKIIAQDSGNLPGKHIPDHAAADCSKNAAEDHSDETDFILNSLRGSDCSENAQSDGISELDQVPKMHPVFCRPENDQPDADADSQIGPMLQGRNRYGPENRIPDHAAADTDTASQHGYSEHVQLAAYAFHGSRRGENRRTEQIQQ